MRDLSIRNCLINTHLMAHFVLVNFLKKIVKKAMANPITRDLVKIAHSKCITMNSVVIPKYTIRTRIIRYLFGFNERVSSEIVQIGLIKLLFIIHNISYSKYKSFEKKYRQSEKEIMALISRISELMLAFSIISGDIKIDFEAKLRRRNTATWLLTDG